MCSIVIRNTIRVALALGEPINQCCALMVLQEGLPNILKINAKPFNREPNTKGIYLTTQSADLLSKPSQVQS